MAQGELYESHKFSYAFIFSSFSVCHNIMKFETIRFCLGNCLGSWISRKKVLVSAHPPPKKLSKIIILRNWNYSAPKKGMCVTKVNGTPTFLKKKNIFDMKSCLSAGRGQSFSNTSQKIILLAIYNCGCIISPMWQGPRDLEKYKSSD